MSEDWVVKTLFSTLCQACSSPPYRLWAMVGAEFLATAASDLAAVRKDRPCSTGARISGREERLKRGVKNGLFNRSLWRPRDYFTSLHVLSSWRETPAHRVSPYARVRWIHCGVDKAMPPVLKPEGPSLKFSHINAMLVIIVNVISHLNHFKISSYRI